MATLSTLTETHAPYIAPEQYIVANENNQMYVP